ALDLAGRYRWTREISTRLGFRDLFDAGHMEYRSDLVNPTDAEIPTSIYLGVEWRQDRP
ncbi:MAG: hypothetical protein IT349_18625, partial [Candidatus Eisenbacteria bacterium]|nr:hypothetical protein [Candidatus Eisenbacteria bacterium]